MTPEDRIAALEQLVARMEERLLAMSGELELVRGEWATLGQQLIRMSTLQAVRDTQFEHGGHLERLDTAVAMLTDLVTQQVVGGLNVLLAHTAALVSGKPVEP